MGRDIDSVSDHVRGGIPNVIETQLHNAPWGEAHGIMWFRLPDMTKGIQVLPRRGKCPFLIEDDDMHTAADAIIATNIDNVGSNVATCLQPLTWRKR